MNSSMNASSTTASILAEADRRRELRNYVFNPVGAPAAYKYFSRAEYYNTTAIYNHDMTAARKELKTVKTDDLDVDQPKDKQREYAIPGQIKRDTAAVAGGKQVIIYLVICIRTRTYPTLIPRKYADLLNKDTC